MPRRNKPAAFQGERGAFSQVAVQQFLGHDAPVLPCQTFEEVFRTLSESRVDAAVKR